jgi:hypothetical protein
VRPEDVRRVARKLFNHPRRSILALGPKPARSAWRQFSALTQSSRDGASK